MECHATTGGDRAAGQNIAGLGRHQSGGLETVKHLKALMFTFKSVNGIFPSTQPNRDIRVLTVSQSEADLCSVSRTDDSSCSSTHTGEMASGRQLNAPRNAQSGLSTSEGIANPSFPSLDNIDARRDNERQSDLNVRHTPIIVGVPTLAE